MSLTIKSLEYYLPRKIETNQYLQEQHPHWNVDKVAQKSGVLQRHIASENETAYDLSLKACEKIFEKVDKSKVDGIIYCTQSPDYIMPSNSFLLHRDLGLKHSVFAYDFNHACTGYIYGLAMAQGFIKSGLADVILLVNTDTYSKYINKKDRSTRVLFGDAAAVTVVENSTNGKGIIDLQFGSCGDQFDKFWIPAGGLRLPKSEETNVEFEDHLGNIHSQNDISMDGLAVWSFINSVVPKHINDLLIRNNMNKNDVDQFIFHQASLMTLDSIKKALNLSEEKVFINISNVGNTVSASIPIALKDAIDQEKIRKGSIIVLSGFGVGLSYGTILMEY